jgi:Outer membrane protein beta-barrel domain
MQKYFIKKNVCKPKTQKLIVMKKIIIVALMAISTAATAQKGFGIRVGINIANFRDDQDNSATSSVTGYTAAIFYKVLTPAALVFKPELSVATQGGAVKISNIRSTTKTAYVAGAAILSTEGGDKKIFFEGGVKLGTLINAKQEVNSAAKDIKDSLKTMDMAIVLGLGYKLTNNLYAEARYDYGLTDISKTKNNKSYNNVLQITLAYCFTTGKRK